jgi:hypothetical protein
MNVSLYCRAGAPTQANHAVTRARALGVAQTRHCCQASATATWTLCPAGEPPAWCAGSLFLATYGIWILTYGHQIGSQCPVLRAKQGKRCPIGFSGAWCAWTLLGATSTGASKETQKEGKMRKIWDGGGGG